MTCGLVRMGAKALILLTIAQMPLQPIYFRDLSKYTIEEEKPSKGQNNAHHEVKLNETYLLAQLIEQEAGADWCSNKMQLYVGSVVLNRVKSDLFPNTIKDVIYQEGQYYCVEVGTIRCIPSQRALEHAEWLMENGSCLPDRVLFQAEFEQGDGVFEQVQNEYFCYKEEYDEETN